eukprot:CAMPEP_0172786680 /NCGR_PEP_ID=MMETSP1074-20121228/206070_1 /TAXON_ID=2916 /ORGANISM="Ceratium fusus, Strain PA161109" /LENGTH=300 /DNA_ID=CAMNT_0013623695 /DNA_START=93 /DNA_END=992 /DNA_ORIENTATION=-
MEDTGEEEDDFNVAGVLSPLRLPRAWSKPPKMLMIADWGEELLGTTATANKASPAFSADRTVCQTFPSGQQPGERIAPACSDVPTTSLEPGASGHSCAVPWPIAFAAQERQEDTNVGSKCKSRPSLTSIGSGSMSAADTRFVRDAASYRGLRPSRNSRPAPTSRWWADVQVVCPLTQFPVNQLPYPPFRLQLHGGLEDTVLIDCQYLVVSVLTTWCFEAAGKPLTAADITAIDAHMKRCKIGFFRLGKALNLLAKGTANAQHELVALRGRAGEKLEKLKRIQQVRLNHFETLNRQAAAGR